MKVSLLFLLVAALLLAAPLVEAAKKKSKGGDAARYHDCDSCVDAGYGWDWTDEVCGSFANTDCTNPHDSEQSSSPHDSDIDTDNGSDENVDHGDDDDIVDDSDSAGVKDFSWADTEITTLIWQLVNQGDYSRISQLLEQDPDFVRYRSADGRGALWWAHEYGQDEIADLLISHGADTEATDRYGKRPADMTAARDEL